MQAFVSISLKVFGFWCRLHNCFDGTLSNICLPVHIMISFPGDIAFLVWVWRLVGQNTWTETLSWAERYVSISETFWINLQINKGSVLQSAFMATDLLRVLETLHCDCLITVQIFSGKLGVRNAGFRFRKTDWRGLVIEWRHILQKRQACHPNPPKSFPQAGEALSLGSQKMCCNFRRSGPTSISLEPEYSNNISWLVVRMLAWYADISTSCRSTASIDAAISLHMFSIVLSSRSIFPNSSQQLDSFDSTTLTALSASSVLRCSFRHDCWKVHARNLED